MTTPWNHGCRWIRLCRAFAVGHSARTSSATPQRSSPEADENLGQLFVIAIGQIRYRPRESGETFETSDVTLPDVGDERIFVGPDVEGLDDKAGAFELKRYMSAAGGELKHPALAAWRRVTPARSSRNRA